MLLDVLQSGIEIAKKIHQERLAKKIYANNEWWIQIQEVMPGWFLAVKTRTQIPAQVFLISQSEADAIYQEIIFKKFKE